MVSASIHNVTTKFEFFKILLLIKSDVWLEISMTTSFLASMPFGLTPCISIPAECTFQSQPSMCLAQPSAI
ncbi:hypothetical protein SA19142_08840 [Staphylococcus argenteus]|nr:hypothetical protein SARG0275_16690 [Staphylococcus argenteus]GBU03083.1 hypothetical protein SARG0275_21640 [Staphylococcus argenteus]GJF37697.1 hypothetical protein SA19023_24520 [Staphylococcus argenteus]GJF44286.1 hypothetical protein SA19061_13760 [Staphylococcus argenteus]GJF55264.1 hypothetical protein SA19088_20070 [Staphylococcus argenteus]